MKRSKIYLSLVYLAIFLIMLSCKTTARRQVPNRISNDELTIEYIVAKAMIEKEINKADMFSGAVFIVVSPVTEKRILQEYSNSPRSIATLEKAYKGKEGHYYNKDNSRPGRVIWVREIFQNKGLGNVPDFIFEKLKLDRKSVDAVVDASIYSGKYESILIYYFLQKKNDEWNIIRSFPYAMT